MAKITGAEILIQCLIEEGVKHIFGYPGGAIIPLTDKFYDVKEIRFILTRHEQGASHAADGYARATGKVGVCLATSGPGGTNLVTGIATAYMDSIPMVAITGQVKTSLIGNDAFQEADIVGVTRPITKHNYLVKDISELAKTMKEAFHIARTGRPGPVLVDVPVDIQLQTAEFEYPKTVSIRGYKPTLKGHPGQVKKLAKEINKSKKPILYIGGGVIASGAGKELTTLARKSNIPVTMTLMGLGSFPGEDPLCLGMLGMHGTAYANMAMQESDLVISIGARFDDRVTGDVDAFCPKATIAHIDIDPSSVSKNIPVHIPVIGDAKEVIKELIPLVERKEYKEWHDQLNGWRKEFPLKYKNDDGKLRAQYVLERLYELTKDRKIVMTTDVGQHQMWAAQYYKFQDPRSFISSGGLGTMGYGFPAAMGAQLAVPDSTVFCVSGDGSLQMCAYELATCVIENIPVKIVNLNNNCLGMVRQWQELFYDKRYAFTMLNGKTEDTFFCPDFVKLADSFGAKGIRIDKKEDVDAAIKKSMELDGPVVLDFIIEVEENVYPMVPSGGSLSNMLHGLA